MAELLALATGRRKESVARVFLYQGAGVITINERPIDEYFRTFAQKGRAVEPLRAVNLEGHYDVWATIKGGGTTGQSDALRLGIARALEKMDPDLRMQLKKGGFLTRDARKVEPKKYGLRKARRAPQYTKR